MRPSRSTWMDTNGSDTTWSGAKHQSSLCSVTTVSPSATMRCRWWTWEGTRSKPIRSLRSIAAGPV